MPLLPKICWNTLDTFMWDCITCVYLKFILDESQKDRGSLRRHLCRDPLSFSVFGLLHLKDCKVLINGPELAIPGREAPAPGQLFGVECALLVTSRLRVQTLLHQPAEPAQTSVNVSPNTSPDLQELQAMWPSSMRFDISFVNHLTSRLISMWAQSCQKP